METANKFINRRSECFKEVLDKYIKNPHDRYLKWLPDINRKGKYGFLREAWTFIGQSDIKEKIFIIERLKLKKIIEPITHKKMKVGKVEYRIGYYMVGKNGNRVNKWTWGESCPIISASDLKKLMKNAKKEGTIK